MVTLIMVQKLQKNATILLTGYQGKGFTGQMTGGPKPLSSSLLLHIPLLLNSPVTMANLHSVPLPTLSG